MHRIILPQQQESISKNRFKILF